MRYADASVIAAAYLPDEADHAAARERILDDAEPVVTTELARAEVASAIAAAARAARIPPGVALARFEADCAPGGPIQLLAFRSEPVLTRAVRLLGEHPVFALDAIHLAAALEQALPMAAGEPLAFLTSDRRQAAAAKALGLHDPDDPSFRAAMAALEEPGTFLMSDDD